jgi:hypothetical protein
VLFAFFKKLIQHYIDNFVDWMRMVKFDLELESQIKKYHDSYWREVAKEKPKIIEKVHLEKMVGLFLLEI